MKTFHRVNSNTQRPAGQPWTAEEDQLLRDTYPTQGVKACGKLLPHRTLDAIYQAVKRLGVKRIRPPAKRVRRRAQ